MCPRNCSIDRRRRGWMRAWTRIISVQRGGGPSVATVPEGDYLKGLLLLRVNHGNHESSIAFRSLVGRTDALALCFPRRLRGADGHDGPERLRRARKACAGLLRHVEFSRQAERAPSSPAHGARPVATSFIVVSIDVHEQGGGRSSIGAVSWAVLCSDNAGRVAYARRLYQGRAATDDFVSRREYAMSRSRGSTAGRISATWARAVPCRRFSVATGVERIDDRRACSCSRK
jgi:hypothetical protein